MTYRIRPVSIDDQGNVVPGKRTQSIVWPVKLRIGGLYFFRPGKLYRVEGEITER